MLCSYVKRWRRASSKGSNLLGTLIFWPSSSFCFVAGRYDHEEKNSERLREKAAEAKRKAQEATDPAVRVIVVTSRTPRP